MWLIPDRSSQEAPAAPRKEATQPGMLNTQDPCVHPMHRWDLLKVQTVPPHMHAIETPHCSSK